MFTESQREKLWQSIPQEFPRARGEFILITRYQRSYVENTPTPLTHRPPLTSHQNANDWKSEMKTGNSCWKAVRPCRFLTLLSLPLVSSVSRQMSNLAYMRRRSARWQKKPLLLSRSAAGTFGDKLTTTCLTNCKNRWFHGWFPASTETNTRGAADIYTFSAPETLILTLQYTYD